MEQPQRTDDHQIYLQQIVESGSNQMWKVVAIHMIESDWISMNRISSRIMRRNQKMNWFQSPSPLITVQLNRKVKPKSKIESVHGRTHRVVHRLTRIRIQVQIQRRKENANESENTKNKRNPKNPRRRRRLRSNFFYFK